MNNTIEIPAEKMKEVFLSILLNHQFEKEGAETCAAVFTVNSIDGVYTHGVNRFYSFIKLVEKGFVFPNNEPERIHATKALEQWDGKLAPGVLNAIKSTGRAVQLAKKNGIGCVALSNTNHWMRGGYYGWQAAKNNCVFIGWTNTIANMPAWGAVDARLGNNPLVIAIPFNGEAIVLDMAASQFSYGALQLAKMKNEELPVDGGFDKEGKLTKDPSAVLESKRVLPVGYWKGAGLSLLLDILSAVLASGLSTREISERKYEYALSQVFIAIDLEQLKNYKGIEVCINNIISDYKQSVPAEGKEILYPGERVLKSRERNLKYGIPVIREVWDKITSL
jgi:3-dehydro-L-gulonate 2-dehydrogenase